MLQRMTRVALGVLLLVGGLTLAGCNSKPADKPTMDSGKMSDDKMGSDGKMMTMPDGSKMPADKMKMDK